MDVFVHHEYSPDRYYFDLFMRDHFISGPVRRPAPDFSWQPGPVMTGGMQEP
jgi:hypothetical protein